jgi:hypothetical protein
MAQLHITDEEVVALVHTLAKRRGESATAAVREAVEAALERTPQINQDRVNRILDLARRVRESADPQWLAKDPIDDLYDEYGLPK